MKNNEQQWILLKQPFSKEIHEALQQQHHAVQFIALAGKYLIPVKADDSNTNMQFIPETKTVYGNKLSNGLQLALNLAKLKLFLTNDFEPASEEITFDGKTKDMVFSGLKELLQSKGIDTAELKTELHYEIPMHGLDKGGFFNTNNIAASEENIKYRNNAQIVISQIVENTPQAEAVRIWPHHFDTGSFIPVELNAQGNLTKSIGIGLAIPDTMVQEPYFYLSFWMENPSETVQLADLPAGKWMMPGWNGAVLTVSELLQQKTTGEQMTAVISFFEKGINRIRKDVFGK